MTGTRSYVNENNTRSTRHFQSHPTARSEKSGWNDCHPGSARQSEIFAARLALPITVYNDALFLTLGADGMIWPNFAARTDVIDRLQLQAILKRMEAGEGGVTGQVSGF
jgi:hypothetical protein